MYTYGWYAMNYNFVKQYGTCVAIGHSVLETVSFLSGGASAGDMNSGKG